MACLERNDKRGLSTGGDAVGYIVLHQNSEDPGRRVLTVIVTVPEGMEASIAGEGYCGQHPCIYMQQLKVHFLQFSVPNVVMDTNNL